MKQKPKHRYGSKTTDKICKIIEEELLSIGQMCKKYGDQLPTKRTIYQWRRDHVEFREAINCAYETLVMSWIDELDELSNAKMPIFDNKAEATSWREDRRARMEGLKFMIGKASQAITNKFDKTTKVEHSGDNVGATQILITNYSTEDLSKKLQDANERYIPTGEDK